MLYKKRHEHIVIFLFLMLLFLKILYNKILYIIYPVLTVLTFVYSQYSSNPYQPLRADTEGNGSQARKSNNRKQIRKVINYSRPFLEG